MDNRNQALMTTGMEEEDDAFSDAINAVNAIDEEAKGLEHEIKVVVNVAEQVQAIGAARLDAEYLAEEATRAIEAAEKSLDSAGASDDAEAYSDHGATEFSQAVSSVTELEQIDEGPITQSDIRLVQESFAKVAPIAEAVAELFYTRLFELDSSVRGMFKGDMLEQVQRLMGMIQVAVEGLDELSVLVPVVQDLGRRHHGYGVMTGPRQ